ncbi:MAG: beta-aspartyl-peptidase [Oscillospiraceae bacterium]|nr:beta-aspartyl-peptidase [Oscillospiraceae bacterium]
MLLIRNAKLYAPEDRGIQDILLCGDKILAVGPSLDPLLPDTQVIDADGRAVIPGLIDQHVHITGGGGESSFSSRVPEIQLSSILRSGVTTVVGVLGTDSRTRSVHNLVAKTKALNEEGITAFCLTGAYEYPSPTITGSVADDIVFIQEVLGVKLAISDHRCSHLSREELTHLAAQVRIAGLLSGKPGVVHLHTGRSGQGLGLVFDVLENSPIPIQHFRPTHCCNCTEDALRFASMGGFIDFTSDEDALPIAKVLARALETAPEGHVTLSSDSNGSMPKWGPNQELIGITAAKMTSLYKTILCLHRECGVDFSRALALCTRSVAQALGLAPRKGCLVPGGDADLVLLDGDLQADTVIARGRVMMRDGNVLVKGRYEE